jgi:tRNA A37 N6-isopentenylltransferase MiaA
MTVQDVLASIEAALNEPGTDKSGEYLRELVTHRIRRALPADRQSAIKALEVWLQSRSEPRTMVAVIIAAELKLSELRPEIEQLRIDIESGRAFYLYYLSNVDKVLYKLRPKDKSRSQQD